MLHVLLSILSYDIWFYISHVILHTKGIYIYHKQHHRKAEITFIDTYDVHWVEGVFQGVGMLFPYALYTYSLTDTFIVLALLNIRGMMRHDDRCTFLIGNHHLLHHINPNYNFGEYWIDSLCGTKYPNAKHYVYGRIYI